MGTQINEYTLPLRKETTGE